MKCRFHTIERQDKDGERTGVLRVHLKEHNASCKNTPAYLVWVGATTVLNPEGAVEGWKGGHELPLCKEHLYEIKNAGARVKFKPIHEAAKASGSCRPSGGKVWKRHNWSKDKDKPKYCQRCGYRPEIGKKETVG